MVDTKQQQQNNSTSRRRLTTQQRLDTQHLLAAPRLPSTTPPSILSQPTIPKSPSTTRLRMLPQPTTPRLHLISIPKRSSTSLNRTSTTLPVTTQPLVAAKYYVAQTYNTAAVPSYYVKL
ncbi:hypothetical protein DAPPUDRAFT_308792 [Daphnia pulex]|uniref:Uncharacterized protein n=1 Tax=Daphnia pulex TaxID=6669 RepID=E9H9C7_DAPPU|nr:hypothetical protein DAPPUDRAFT_308792 [Daphnia pulex]|eukprot:EFX71599.1 hypothetical protein DAPPUDRAFT_308792 [Daphnia pulex]